MPGARSPRGSKQPVSRRNYVDFVEVLAGIVHDAKEMQKAGRLLDPVSRTEVSLLEHQLRVLEARLMAAAASDGSAFTERAAAVNDWARALQAASEATRGHSRRLRKDLYRTRTMIASGPD